MASERWLPILVFVVLTGLIAAPFLIDHVRESRRPVMVEARVVTAAASDPVYRTGRRTVSEGDPVEVAVAVRVTRKGTDDRWLSPAANLEIDGIQVDHVQSSAWPEDDRHLRVFWFSIESTHLGGELTTETAADRLAYRTFLAPEMGRTLQAERLPEIHNDDHIGEPPLWSVAPRVAPLDAGTIRLYARIEVVEELDSLRPLQAVTTLGVDHLLEPRFPTLLRRAAYGEGIDPVAAELLRLPGFEPAGATIDQQEAVTMTAFGLSFSEMVEARLVVSSRALASTAATGAAGMTSSDLEDLGTVDLSGARCTRRGRPLRWGDDLRQGDLLSAEAHWMILLGDDGDGLLGGGDPVLHSWGRPPNETTLVAAAGPEEAALTHWRPRR